jgi:hypothetical protein
MSSTPSKRKSHRDLAPTQTNKKAKSTPEHKLNVSDESFRTAQTPHFGVVQPIGTQTGTIPLDYKEKRRMKEWYWPERSLKRDLESIEEGEEMESPKGTTRIWWV